MPSANSGAPGAKLGKLKLYTTLCSKHELYAGTADADTACLTCNADSIDSIHSLDRSASTVVSQKRGAPQCTDSGGFPQIPVDLHNAVISVDDFGGQVQCRAAVWWLIGVAEGGALRLVGGT